MTPWKEFKKINKNYFYKNEIKTIVDPFGLMNSFTEFFKKKKIKYYSLH